jgi:hypothetical protein
VFYPLIESPETVGLQGLLAEHVRLEIIQIPQRHPGMSATQVDLANYYNRALRGSSEWPMERLPVLIPDGQAVLGRLVFDARGLIQLGSRSFWMYHRPAAVSNIVIGLPCRAFNFLHGTIGAENEGKPIGQYAVHFQRGSTHTISIVYGKDVADWQSEPDQKNRRGWRFSTSGTNSVWLYTTRWQSPGPGERIDLLDIVSLQTESSPFLVAITGEVNGPVTEVDNSRESSPVESDIRRQK